MRLLPLGGLLLLGLAAALPARAASETIADPTAPLTKLMNRGASLLDERAKLPEEALVKRDRKDADADLDALMGEAVDILDATQAGDARRRIDEMRGRIGLLRERVAALKVERATAPEQGSTSSEILSRIGLASPSSKGEYDRSIARAEAEIADLERGVTEATNEFIAALEQLGIRLPPDSVRSLLSSVDGDDVLRVITAYRLLEQINSTLQAALKEAGNGSEVARRYYGIYTVMLRTLALVQQRALDRIDQTYMPRLAAMEGETAELQKSAVSLLAGERDPVHRANLEANRSVLGLTRTMLGTYKDHLQTQRASLARSAADVARALAVARNSYGTARMASDLSRLMRSADDMFSKLGDIHPPGLAAFPDDGIRLEFEQITQRLKTPTS